MKKRNNSKATNNWLATAVAAALTLCCTTVSAQPTTHADAAISKTSHEEVAWDWPKYFTNEDGTIFEFFEIYNIEDGEELTNSMLGRELPSGVVCKPFEGEAPYYVQQYADMDKWNTDGTFTYNGEEYQYNLVAPSALTREHRVIVENTIVHNLPTNPEKISYFDYSKDGRIMVNDLVLLNKFLMYNPMNSVTNCDPVMYQEMDKDTFFQNLQYWTDFGNNTIYIRYGDKVPQDTVTTTTATSTTSTTTTTSTETTTITWNIDIAKGITGNDVVWYEVDTNEQQFIIPSSETIFAKSAVEIGNQRTITAEDTEEYINRLLEIPTKLGISSDEFRLVVSNEPIYYSWLTTNFEEIGISDGVYQICPSEELYRFKHIYADGIDIGNGRTLIDTSNVSMWIMWCPGSWIDYHPWYGNDQDEMKVDGSYTDMVIDPIDKFEYIYDVTGYECYFSLIPKDSSKLCFGAGTV